MTPDVHMACCRHDPNIIAQSDNRSRRARHISSPLSTIGTEVVPRDRDPGMAYHTSVYCPQRDNVQDCHVVLQLFSKIEQGASGGKAIDKREQGQKRRAALKEHFRQHKHFTYLILDTHTSRG